jgi:hypothetical protein
MRDPRYEPAQMEIPGGCTAGLPSTLRVRTLLLDPTAGDPKLVLDVTRIDERAPPIRIERSLPRDASSVELPLPPFPAGAYAARLRIAGGATTRHDFACEAGGDEWSDSRPDATRLERLAQANGGSFVFAPQAADLTLPRPTVVSAERHVTPLAPPWVWTLVATVLLGLHWLARRRSGLA